MRKLSMLVVPGLVAMTLAAAPVLSSVAAEIGHLDQEGQEEELFRQRPQIPRGLPHRLRRDLRQARLQGRDRPAEVAQAQRLRRRRQPDRLLLSQARRLPVFEGLL